MVYTFKNDAQTTLSGDITNVATSLVVADATNFPTSGDFIVKIDLEYIKVTSVSSNTFTITRAQEGSTGVSHVSGASVTLVITEGILESFSQVIPSFLPFDIRPTTAHAKDDEFDGSVLNGKWSTNSACVSTNTVANGAVTMNVGTTTTRGGYMLAQTFSGTSFTITAKIATNAFSGDGRIGIFCASTSDGKINIIGSGRGNNRLANADGSTGYSASVQWNGYDGYDAYDGPMWPGLIWVRISFAAGVITFNYSADGSTWRSPTWTRSAQTQPDRFGLVLWSNSGNVVSNVSLVSEWFRVTEP